MLWCRRIDIALDDFAYKRDMNGTAHNNIRTVIKSMAQAFEKKVESLWSFSASVPS